MSAAVDARILAGRYSIEGEIGRGGMGVVYRATDLKLGRLVAVKFLDREATSGLSTDRFVREIRATARLRHPQILQVDDSGDVDGELYYVMQYVGGATLRERLQRGARFPVREALRITRQVASALANAHAHGVVHRDIKPDNILLDDGGHVYVADFGLADVLSEVTSSPLTRPGLTVGSPAYMSPEQALGEAEVDGRSDIYSLGCVLYEMLVGQPPFAGSGAETMRRHVTEAAPAVRRRRADVPASVDQLLGRMLAKAPGDRFASADALCDALDLELGRLGAGAPVEARRPWTARRLAIAAALTAVGGAILWYTGTRAAEAGWIGGAPPDSTRWVVLPLQWEAGSTERDRAHDVMLHASLARWHDLDVVPRAVVEEEVDDAPAVRASMGLRIADRLDAGRYVHGMASAIGDSIQVDLALGDAARERVLRRASMRMPRGRPDPAAYAVLVDSLLFGRVTWDGRRDASIGTSSAAARRSYGEAHRALEAWDLARADTLLRRALEHDPEFARAHLWRAQLGAWRGDRPRGGFWSSRWTPAWLRSARLAASRPQSLTERERLLADGLMQLAEGLHPQACATYETLVRRDDRDPAAWFGLGECVVSNDRVVRDPRSPSGWRFEASYHRGVAAFRRAFELAPRSHRVFRENSYARIRDGILFTRHNERRFGWSVTNERFSARPQWQSDSLLFVPFAWPQGQPHPEPPLAGVDEALLRQRYVFASLARGWARADPQSSDALHAVALSLEITGDAAALDTLMRARTLARTPADQFELAVQEVWLRVKLGTGSVPSLRRATALGDSLLDSPEATRPSNAGRMAALAVLLGRPAAAAMHARHEAEATVETTDPGVLTAPAAALLAFSAVGAPVDSIVALERQIEAAIRNTMPEAEWASLRRDFLERAAILAHPGHTFAIIREERPRSIHAPQSIAIRALLAADTVAARRALRAVTAVTPDMVLPTATIAVAAGDTSGAIAMLDSSLEQIRWLQPGMIEDMAHAGALVRAMLLRAEMGARVGDASATRRWGDAATTLWGRGEPAVQLALRRVNGLLESVE